jgi:hypothetical protein
MLNNTDITEKPTRKKLNVAEILAREILKKSELVS